MFVRYALVNKAEDAVLKFHLVHKDDAVIIPKLLAHRYRPVIETVTPIYDNVTQTLTDRYDIETDAVFRRWKVSERPFRTAKELKYNQIRSQTLDQIAFAFDDTAETEKVADALAAKNTVQGKIRAALTNDDLRKIKLASAVEAEKQKGVA